MSTPNEYIDLDSLIQVIDPAHPDSVAQFAIVVSGMTTEWLLNHGLPPEEVQAIAPECIMSLTILVIKRRGSIPPGRVIAWLREQTRNLVVRYWREADERETPPTMLTVGRAHEVLSGLNGTWKGYRRAARQLGVSAKWLRSHHREVEALLGNGAGESQDLSA